MKIKIKRNGRIWKGPKKNEEVLDVFYGENCEKKLSGLCYNAFKKIIKEPLVIGEGLIIKLEIQSKEKKEEKMEYSPDSHIEPPYGIRRNGYGSGGHRHG